MVRYNNTCIRSLSLQLDCKLVCSTFIRFIHVFMILNEAKLFYPSFISYESHYEALTKLTNEALTKIK